MTSSIKHIAKSIRDFAKALTAKLPLNMLAHFRVSRSSYDRELQILLVREYARSQYLSEPLPSFSDIEFSRYSQNGEDGILLFLLTMIGSGSKRVVEIGCGDGLECNSANLIINHGWSALLVDGDVSAIARGKRFYRQETNAWRLHRLRPIMQHTWITQENINSILERNGFLGEVDLLSIDVDGVDYWIWAAISCISPRVVVVEYNNRWGPDECVTVPYNSNFVGSGASEKGEGFFGASLAAFVKLGRLKGYRLVGSNSINTNAFFLRDDVCQSIFPEVSAASCLSSDYARHQRANRSPSLESRELVQV